MCPKRNHNITDIFHLLLSVDHSGSSLPTPALLETGLQSFDHPALLSPRTRTPVGWAFLELQKALHFINHFPFHPLSHPRPPLTRGRWLSDKEFSCQCRRHEFHPWGRNIPWRRKWQPTPVFLLGKVHGQRTPVG